MNSTHRRSLLAKLPTLKRRAAYSLAAGAAAGAGATDAQAAINYSGPQNINIGSGFSQNLNLDGDAFQDINLKNFVFGGGPYQGAYVNFFPGKVVGFFSGSLGYASALSAGALIDGTTATGPFQASMAYGANNPNAQFNNVTDAYIGVGFPIAAVNHYGWIRVDVNNAAKTFVIKDWAYEDLPGAAIHAGEIPEPGSLGLLAAGAAGIAALRRKGQQAA